ncbi:glycoside hydrolase family 61 protein [Niveomyces insectorum RCEF 264]|uniref:lytic cellulose monooxygenase (C4-dehydrogenating) n=1 Tax=Niveomyces insectorum RCEF 264 TaxID=1081102 RepID=A0A167Q9I2_9HYPO|nr:glycoside hydrolase family 61 protein [Niveomyces insectorum RCEF 264]
MKSSWTAAAYGLLAARQAAGHATFQDLWVAGTDMIRILILPFFFFSFLQLIAPNTLQHGTQCARLPLSNNPVTDVSSTAIRCNLGTKPVGYKCAVAPGSTVTVEMHQQPGDRSCGSQAIGGAHYGPVSVYLSKVPDSSTADGSTGWFKVFEDGWAASPSGGSGDDDQWGTKDLNTCCGKMDVPLPADLDAGDYLLRAEALALHTAGSAGGAQFYMTCYQLQVGGGGGGASNASTSTLSIAASDIVKFPGAYKASDPGILINIHAKVASYQAPGPAVIAGGTTRKAGSACPAAAATSGASPDGSAAGAGAASCEVAQFGQCGGTGYTGGTNCAAGLSCKGVSAPYYSQCA